MRDPFGPQGPAPAITFPHCTSDPGLSPEENATRCAEGCGNRTFPIRPMTYEYLEQFVEAILVGVGRAQETKGLALLSPHTYAHAINLALGADLDLTFFRRHADIPTVLAIREEAWKVNGLDTIIGPVLDLLTPVLKQGAGALVSEFKGELLALLREGLGKVREALAGPDSTSPSPRPEAPPASPPSGES